MNEWLAKVPLEEDYFDHYLYPEQEFIRAIEEWCEHYPKLLDWKEYHCKFGIVIDNKAKNDYCQQLEIYEAIKNANISPRLIHNEILYDKSPIFIYLFVTEKYGKDLGEVFIDGRVEHIAESSDKLLTNEQLFEEVFPKNRIPNMVILQIKDLLQRFQDIGYIHNDVWCRNLLIKDGVVKLIDFEYCTKIY